MPRQGQQSARQLQNRQGLQGAVSLLGLSRLASQQIFMSHDLMQTCFKAGQAVLAKVEIGEVRVGRQQWQVDQAIAGEVQALQDGQGGQALCVLHQIAAQVQNFQS